MSSERITFQFKCLMLQFDVVPGTIISFSLIPQHPQPFSDGLDGF
ncbi:hypothetical protein SKA58_16558 [Sphingomonas sp. SKA58]|nr:hypothetical protein SKA58_16558 [Sphingomonas sp. SKA58]